MVVVLDGVKDVGVRGVVHDDDNDVTSDPGLLHIPLRYKTSSIVAEGSEEK